MEGEMPENWSERWNALPDDVRKIGSMCEIQMRIQQLQAEKERLRKRYEASKREVNEHIQNLRRTLRTEGQ